MATTAQSSSIPPAPNEYGGDEVAAIVLDPGNHTTRAGFAGEDTPKSVIPTYYGVRSLQDSKQEYLYGDNAIHTPLPGLEIKSPMSSDGSVEDWDLAAKIWEYSITSRLTNKRQTSPSKNGLNDSTNGDADVTMEDAETMEKPLAENPLLMTEPSWTSPKAREKTVELALEDWGTPAFWIGKTGVLAAFSSGKGTALVIDVGAANITVTPVGDGFVLKKGIMKSPLAGNFVSQQIRLMFSQAQPPVPLTPHYMVQSKTPVDAGAPSQAILKQFETPPAPSFRHFEEERVLTEFKESVVQIWGPGRLSGSSQGTPHEEMVKALPGRPFEMPDGWNQVFGPERFRVAEGLFDAKAALSNADSPPIKADHSIPSLLQNSLNAVDIDSRPNLLSNIIVTGGSSLLNGFTERLGNEIQTLFPGPRTKVTASNNMVERKFGSWIGGSILSSLGNFQQMWVSKREYEEHGFAIVEKRCR